MLLGRLLLWQADQSFLGRDVHESAGKFEFVALRLGIPLEPTQLFEAAVELVNFFILMWLFKRKKFDGQVLGGLLSFFMAWRRYFLEFLRDDPGRGEVFGGIMTGTQLISIGLVIMAAD